ncbi:TIGR03668 family PPOX class F420-dependent oxidoreductase [Nonomuraea typhae]|uniref:TIGR03668 family PPOX class F420-dependent oxidoreductase n=1 Tax=Nonomuraea typhae TaxID=2603600 RepID=UPI0012F8BB09|nr:TIGR03668 family PPOX class F420-dependent oxidoreductase [Nonomuraea typhae]
MDQVEARSRFASARVARLATADRDGVPHLVPVTFDVDGDTVAFVIDHKPKKTLNLRRLRNIADNPRVSLLVDEYADDWNSLWWARADGTAEIVEAGARRDRAVGRLSERYDQYRENPPQGPAVLIAVSAWSGWAYTA